MVVVDPGVYQDRAGMLFGPFSPIYGFGAVLMTMALNRFYKKNPLIIFLVSALIGGAFEVFVGWFMQTSFGVVSWSYSHIRLFGMPDPIAVLTGGRTCTPFACMWGLGGLIWIKVLLPRLLKLINMIPWKRSTIGISASTEPFEIFPSHSSMTSISITNIWRTVFRV